MLFLSLIGFPSNSFNQRKKAVDFVLGFENKLCVYSPTVEQLYTNYNIFFPKEEERKLVILPNPYSPHDTYNGIPVGSVVPTGMEIIPEIYNSKISLEENQTYLRDFKSYLSFS